MPFKIDWPTCEQCGVRHNPEHPHAATTRQYQALFLREHGRLPTYADGMAHCSEQVRELYVKAWRVLDPFWDPTDLAEMDWTPRIEGLEGEES